MASDASESREQLLKEKQQLLLEVKQLRHKLARLTTLSNEEQRDAELSAQARHFTTHLKTRICDCSTNLPRQAQSSWQGTRHSLEKDQIERYSRHAILRSFGVEAQERLSKSSVLVVGVGGLGCPVATYLASSGVGHLGIVDKDEVELSNLHRQILHTEADVGTHKAESAASACRAINSSIKVTAHLQGFFPGNALQLVEQYDLVVDASDNAPTRYLLSDTCCVLGKPLVSGAAIGTDGQLTVYCHDGGPCYRCLYPVPPRPDSCSRCSETGVLGPVPGVIGVLQALEAIKILSGRGTVMSQKLLIADFMSSRFHVVKLRPRQQSCTACGDDPSITAESLGGFDYAAFTGQAYHDSGPGELQLLPKEQRLSPSQFATGRGLVVDVRPAEQFDIAHIPGSMHLPYDENHPEHFEELLKAQLAKDSALQEAEIVTVVCRKGNDSQRVVQTMRKECALNAVDLEGGLLAWATAGHSEFPAL